MAARQLDLSLILRAEDQTAQVFGGFGNRLTGAKILIQDITGPLAAAASAITKAETALLGLGTAFATFASFEAQKFVDGQVELSKVLNENDPDIQSFTKRVDELSITFGVSAESVLKGIATFRQAGFSAKESGDLIKQALDLVIAGDVEFGRATEIIIGTLKGFNLEAAITPDILEGLNNVSNRFATNLGQLATGLQRLSPIANELGFDFNQTIGIITPIIEVFRSGSESANALRTGLLRLIDDSKPVEEALETLGVSQRDLNGELKSGEEIFFQVGRAFQDLAQNERAFVLQQLVGIEQSGRLAVVFRDLDKAIDITNVSLEKTGSVQDEVNKRLDTTRQRLASAQEAFSNFSRSIGLEFDEELGKVAGSFTNLFTAIQGTVDSGGLDRLFDAFEPALRDLEQTLNDVAKNLPEALAGVNFDELIDAFGGLGSEIKTLFGSLFDDLDLSTPEGLRDALQEIVNGVRSLTNVTTGIIENLRPIFETIGFIVEAGNQSGADIEKTAGRILGAAQNIERFGIILGGVLNTFSNFGEVDKDPFADGFLQSTESVGGLLDGLGKIPALLATLTSLNLNLDPDDSVPKLAVSASEAAAAAADLANQAPLAAEGTQSIADSTNELVAANEDFEPLDFGDLNFVAEAQKRIAEETGNVSDNAQTAGENLNSISRAGGTFSVISRGAEEASEKIKDTTNQSDKLRKSLEKIASDERISQLEIRADIDIAQIEATTERIGSLFEFQAKINVEQIRADVEETEIIFGSLDKTIENTGLVLGDAFGILGGLAESGTSGLTAGFRELQKQLEFENDRRDSAVEAEVDAVKARTELIRERTRRLQSGEALIKVQAENLTPALEMIFLEVLKFTQIRANEEELEFLTAIAS